MKFRQQHTFKRCHGHSFSPYCQHVHGLPEPFKIVAGECRAMTDIRQQAVVPSYSCSLARHFDLSYFSAPSLELIRQYICNTVMMYTALNRRRHCGECHKDLPGLQIHQAWSDSTSTDCSRNINDEPDMIAHNDLVRRPRTVILSGAHTTLCVELSERPWGQWCFSRDSKLSCACT